MKKQKESALNAEWKILVKHPTVGTADSHSNRLQVGDLMKMPDKKTFDEHVEDVRSNDKTDHQKRIEELERVAEQKDTTPLYARPINQRIGIGVGAVLIAGLVGAITNPEPLAGFFGMIIVAVGAVWLFVSKHGVAFRKEVTENMEARQQQNQQQTGNDSSQVEQIVCQNCGWKNPAINDYCHDCGNEL